MHAGNKGHHISLSYDKRLKTFHWLRNPAGKKRKKESLQSKRKLIKHALWRAPCFGKRLLKQWFEGDRFVCFVVFRTENWNKTGTGKRVLSWEVLFWWNRFIIKFIWNYFDVLKILFRWIARLHCKWSLKRGLILDIKASYVMLDACVKRNYLIRLKQSQLIHRLLTILK